MYRRHPSRGGGAPTRGLWISLLVVVLAGCDAAPTTTPPPAQAEHDHGAEAAPAARPLETRYVCPMHPQIVRDAPGTCPICGMDLVERALDPLAGRGPEVRLAPGLAQTLGVRTATVERGTLWKYVRTPGRISYDETRLAHLHPRAPGWIEGLSVRALGEPVGAGQELAELYAPEILSAQVDFLLALAPQPEGVARVRVDQARNILRLLDVPEADIRAIERSGETRQTVPVLAPIDGVVTEMKAREGMYVTAADAMYTIADLSRVWVLVDVFEHQIDWIAPGQGAEIRVPAYPGRSWEGEVDYLYPALDPQTRTLRVRLVFDNPEGLLRPNMFAEVVIYGGPRRDVLKIPAEALIETGTATRVVRALDDGRFAPVEVVVGMRRDGEVEILSGLDAGDRVVTSGQFLLDSESSLRAGLDRLSGQTQGGHDHAGH
ncbi:efflux RND transporter periplasmic adaptor subunit [Marichromatium gracile]|uniref:Efflux transporter periplasmic adaptor subunit n=1 Tax=Marichromatium gracile TaxID=1048 RepID=A0ABR5VFW0_MARGR|nr:efflux RND transporter periplasmic adaptor subunit [Marichromatium gracile]KXX64605.1 efflux transporter periplasmic adaptor subunit [Marichromatium gracile]